MELDTPDDGRNALRRADELPDELREIIRIQNTPRFLDTLAQAALQPALTLRAFTAFEGIFADSTARWITGGNIGSQRNEVIGGFARILPLAPHLSTYLEKYLQVTSSSNGNAPQTSRIHGLLENTTLSTLELQRILLGGYRLLNFDKHTFSKSMSGAPIQSLLKHDDRGVRYLAVRILCQLFSASDLKLESMIEEHVGKEAVMGDYDGRQVDLGFLSLLEEKRLGEAYKKLLAVREQALDLNTLSLETLTDLVIRHGNTLLPRPNGPPRQTSVLVPTATTSKNMETFAKSLLYSSPILLHGLAGSGKTSLVNDFARELGYDSNMVSLHLNEQIDAKMLIGMYASGSTPGSFTWRPGVLTTAVKEGRWVFIEDLDRAPNEVISVILPLIERGELLIPSRGETIKAGRGFRLLASIRTSLSVTGQENPPALHMLGARLWQRVPVQMPSQDEFREIIGGTYPILHKFLPGIINVYDHLYSLSHKPSFASRSRTSLGRPISPRDLLKWCRRLDSILVAAGSKTGDEPITDTTTHQMFLEATDCFAGSLQTEETRKTVISSIAEQMQIDPQRVEHFLTSHSPPYADTENELTIGRVRLPKRRTGRVTKPAKKTRPFANTTHARRLLEQVGVAVKMSEPVLLVGETGIGKTTVIQQLADSLGHKLTAVNLSQQSEIGDLLGGFKPVDVRSLGIPLKDEFDELFDATGLSASKNQKYIEQLGKSVAKSNWSKASKLWREAPKMFERILSELKKKEQLNGRPSEEQPMKRRKTESRLQPLLQLKSRWDRFSESLNQFDIQLSGGSNGVAFTFVEGNIVKAARNGEWVLLDEINLASPDTLESIADLLHSGPGSTPSILLSETGEIERVRAHPNFRIFGAMNPATDVGKRDLPMGLRSRFTEIYVGSPDRDLTDLLAIIKAYLKGTSTKDEKAAHDVARLYLNTKNMADDKRLVDGANQVPHFSLRTLTRVLSYVTEIAPSYGLRRALYEGFAMGFLTLLDGESEKLLMPLINHHLLESHGSPDALLGQPPRHPEDGRQYVRFKSQKWDANTKARQYWMLQGMETPVEQPNYIITRFVERNLLNLVRATSTRRFPVLVQGPTSSGKTSMIEYLAKLSGNKFVRINNHEHTDLQEYLGTYVSGTDGKLRFQEGLLVQALRQGHWIVLDELNLAPTDVLEALNRLLDDNRELLIPETQDIVRPHENFMLFATQNPPGLYGGRKVLSRAFRNRFLELHFDDIPEDELHTILKGRARNLAPSHCKDIVDVYKELSKLQQSSRLFEQKSFATLRDLFRWARRGGDKLRKQIAADGYMLLAERVRNPEERIAVQTVIHKVYKGVKIDPAMLYDPQLSPEIQSYNATANTQGVVWTQAMRRLYVLVANALRNNEPVLLVGETGCGKTTVCQMLADAFAKDLHIVNAHQNTETGDLIGAQRPVRNRAAILDQLRQDLIQVLQRGDQSAEDVDVLLASYKSLPAADIANVPESLRERINTNIVKAKSLFEWSDGSLVQAMREGQFFLLDEISLADDSVLERLNSVLETQRTILLAEKGVDNSFVQAADGFQFFATMNPGGDYGKRELSPALRNRFTEIWVPSLSEHEDVLQIVEAKLDAPMKKFSEPMVCFAEWFGQTYRSTSSTSISVRDVLAWIKFMNGCNTTEPYFAVLHGASMVYIDTLGANPAALLAINPESIREERAKCLQKLSVLLQHDVSTIYSRSVEVVNGEQLFKIGEFSIPKQLGSSSDPGFAFEAPTTKLNAMRVLRALQVQKPILIEGSPGVGKTTLIAALARSCNQPLTRINLSEQTDLMDLFGSDVPVEGAEAGHFAWRDAPFLQAMQRGEWVLLDEMNLASQSVLEGLNACLDHRGEVYISELDQTFKRHPNFSVFAAQNPHHQGGGRKGLPSSFVNRFTVVYADVFRNDDLQLICKHNFPAMSDEIVTTIIHFVSHLEQEVVHKRRFGSQGGPWEFNLRDILRWLQLLSSSAPLLSAATPSDFLNLIFRQRFRSLRDRQELDKIFAQVFGSDVPFRHFFHSLSTGAYQVGLAYMHRDPLLQRLPFPAIEPIHRLPEIESVMTCIQQNMPCILVGTSGSGKTTLLQHVAAASGKSLVVFPLNADIDTMDLVGGFEQVDPQRAASGFLEQLTDFLKNRILVSLPAEVPEEAITLLELLTELHTSPSYFSALAKHLRALHAKTTLPEFDNLATTCQRFAETPMALENARFEWVDGVLVKALEQGKWLVLDNANLCSASVLDRLNSLLEPNGFLSINEHCGPDGEPKIVRPHPDFRIFLTMDARFGELSRAMRNRAIEIFLEPLTVDVEASFVKPEASMLNYQSLSKSLDVVYLDIEKTDILHRVALDNLAWSDMSLLLRFVAQQYSSTASRLSKSSQAYLQIYQSSDNQNFRTAIGKMLNQIAQNSAVAPGFRDAQVIHPLQNSPLVPLLQQSGHQVYWLAACFEFLIEIAAAMDVQTGQEVGLDTLKPSKMNRLQRSLVRGRVPAVAKDSTVNVSTFLANCLAVLKSYLQNNIGNGEQWKPRKQAIFAVLQYWRDTYRLATSAAFEEATFQAHLAIGTDLLAGLAENTQHQQQAVIATIKQSLTNDFYSGFNLTTGLSMEILWKYFRPTVIPTSSVLQTLDQLDQVAQRFDALRWKTSISIPELGEIMTSLIKGYQMVLTSAADGPALIEILSSELQKLEASIGKQSNANEDEKEIVSVEPFMATEFEALRQFKALDNIRSGTKDTVADIDTVVLASFPTTSEMRLATSTATSRPLQSIDYIWGNGENFQLISDTFSVSLMRKLNEVGEVRLGSLKLLETELPIMGDKIAKSSATIGLDQLLGLNEILSSLIQDVIAAHDEELAASYRSGSSALSNNPFAGALYVGKAFSAVGQQGQLSFNGQVPAHLREVISSNFSLASAFIATALFPLENGMQCSALAWVQFAIGSLTLYVPDRAFDPDKRQRLERERHQQTRESLQKKLSALLEFEYIFSGQDSNLRCQILETEIEELGEPPVLLQEIYRPDISELDQMQGFFVNLLKNIVKSDLQATLIDYFNNGNDQELNDIRLLQNNVAQIIRHLSGFHAYNDITTPVISMLRCLQIGLTMATLASTGSAAKHVPSEALNKATPFLGGGPISIESATSSSHPLEFLALAEATVATENLSSFQKSQRDALFKTFHECFTQWEERLKSDQAEAESNSGLYRFRGSAEDEDEDDEEQFNELFPAYDEESSSLPSGMTSSSTARDTAVNIARVHADIFLGRGAPSTSIMAFIRHMATRAGARQENGSQKGARNETASLLPGALLLLNDQIESLSPSAAVPESYNFYTDANLPEVRKLVSLVHGIQNRFRELQAVDEIGHMQTLEDVLASCRDLLNFRHTDPLAKIITKVEKVHEFMHEWQHGGWASRVNTAIELYDSLTSTIISWRRMELSTWDKLFDMETNKCEEAARAWWFFAYQIIIAAPLGLSKYPEELIKYAQRLLGNLETYFKTAVVGQFVEQLQLLKQLQKHLELIIVDEPSLAVVNSALSNFISLYARYEKPVQEHLKKGRTSLQKAMKDVVLLASWKDTNIVALKDSAKRSHHKLFKIVRKFRALLGQPMQFIIAQGVPDENHSDIHDPSTPPSILPTVDQAALALFKTSVPNWAHKSKRFVQVSKTVSMMAHVSQIPDSAVQGSPYLDSFLGNIIDTTAELQKATPSTLDEENKVAVKHLKSRKRKLFADTLKELRQMGIKYNLSADALVKQESLSVSLTNVEPLPSRANLDIPGLEYYFHKSIDLAPRAREAAQKHSEDLSSAEVARSTGYLEGILQILLAQHTSLSIASKSLSKLEVNIAMVKGLWGAGKYDLRITSSTSNHEKLLRWLPNILNIALDLIRIHSKLGKTDSQNIQNTILSWKDKFNSFCTDWDSLPSLPTGIISTERLILEQSIANAAQNLAAGLLTLSELRPDLTFILSQIAPWTQLISEPAIPAASSKTLANLHGKLSTICDAILVAIQKHQKSIGDLPGSTEDPNWFVKNDVSLVNNIKSLHSDNVISQIGEAFEMLRLLNLEESETSNAAGAVFAVALPIFQQYFNILQQSIIRYAHLHRATCKTSYILTKTFIQIATQGFCTPPEKSDAQDGKTDKLEGGTGLGDGEGAEDISKDIQDDENLDELAQEPNQEEKGDMEDQEDAVDMADGDMEGEMGDAEEKGSEDGGSDGEDDADEMDEETGDVDDLDPTAVDEKMWDGDGEQAEKDQEGDDSKGKQNKDEQVAAQENDKEAGEGDEGEEEEEMAGAEQGEQVKQDEVEKHDPHAREGEALDLPEDMELDGEQEDGDARPATTR
ncbi:Midasin [Lachnellula suecica]|uniref:Midasin n=1 Tax=Lachnellula suecica TaxID=602035 RepID=A0A8T9CA82_9HELO|nr:Midasin [Lachnellula suecica]